MADTGAAEIINRGLDPLAKDPKATEDFSKAAEEVIEKAEKLVQGGRIDEAVEEMLAVEKKSRMASDGISTSKLICAVVTMFYNAKDMAKVNEYIPLLTKKRSQLKRAIVDLIQLAMGWLVKEDDKSKKLELITTLMSVTEGKIFVEVEGARLTKILAESKEGDGDVDAACSLMQEVQVETFGTMDKMEKTKYILEQMRLCLAKKDFVRTQIISKKINPKLISAEDMQDLKLGYYKYLVQYYLHEGDYMAASNCFQRILDTPKVKETAELWQDAMKMLVLYTALAKRTNEQVDLINRINIFEDYAKLLEQLPVFKAFVTMFVTEEIIRWPLPMEAELKADKAVTEAMGLYLRDEEENRWNTLHKRVIGYNLYVIQQYYTEIRMSRLGTLLGLKMDEAEKEVSELVTDSTPGIKPFTARMDRPQGIVSFSKVNLENVMNTWVSDVTNILQMVDQVSYHVQKEIMVQGSNKKR